jgi:hypothetical protein
VARTGLRMMPTFPPPPLKFRTVGFPQYGFKASLSDPACPARPEVKPAPGMPSGLRWFAMVLRACAGYPTLVAPVHSPKGNPEWSSPTDAPLTPGVLGSDLSYAVSDPPRLLRPHPPVSQAPRDFTVLRLIRAAFAVRERLGDPRDLPAFRCRSVRTCHGPYAGGAAAGSRCAPAAVPGFPEFGAGRPPQGSPLPAMPGECSSRRGILRFMLRPVRLPSPPGWLRRGRRPSPAFRGTVSLPLLAPAVTGRRWEAG